MLWERRERRGGGGRFGGGGGGRGRGGFGGGRSRFRDDKPKPVKEGEVHTVTITEVSRRGDGIARIKNFVVFVPGTQKGDTVKVRIKEVRGNHASAEVIGEGEEAAAPAEAEKTSEEEGPMDEVVEKEGEPKNNSEEAAKEAPKEDKEEFA